MEQNRKAGQNPPKVVAPTEEEEEDVQLLVISCKTSQVVLFNFSEFECTVFSRFEWLRSIEG